MSCLLLALPPMGVSAQAPRAGSVGVGFHLPEGGGTGLGLRYLWSDGVNMGLNFEFDLEYELASDDAPEDENRTTWGIGFVPDIRFYQGGGPVVPFFELGLGAVYAKPELSDLSELLVTGSVGIGAEWFPTASIGIAGSTGLRTTFLHTSLGDEAETTEDRIRLGVFRSALSINLYF